MVIEQCSEIINPHIAEAAGIPPGKPLLPLSQQGRKYPVDFRPVDGQMGAALLVTLGPVDVTHRIENHAWRHVLGDVGLSVLQKRVAH